MAENPMGKATEYPETYNPDLLLAIPRQTNRNLLGLSAELPFKGEDVWNAYELSWLNRRGLPQVAMARFHFTCESPFLIESKSFKLYLNSLNQEKYENREQLNTVLTGDLSGKSGSAVRVEFSEPESTQYAIQAPQGICLDNLDISINHYHPEPSLLVADINNQVQEQLFTNVFRSNCPITNQPDWGSISVSYKGSAISHEGLLAYLVSYRLHNDYHENCVEKIFVEIQDKCRPEQLRVQANFLRRGGLDINPVRSTSGDFKTAMTRFIRQ